MQAPSLQYLKRIVAGLLLLSEPIFAFAGGDEVGNGGTVVICNENEANETIEVLDVFEAREVRQMAFVFPPGNDPYEKARVIIERLRAVDRIRTKKYLLSLRDFAAEARILYNRDFPSTDDASYFPLPRNCRLEQAAIQMAKTYPDDPRYYIKGEIWEQLDANQKAALILHEIIYADALRRGHKSSNDARYFNAFISSKKIENSSISSYQILLKSLLLHEIRWTDKTLEATWLLSEEKYGDIDKAIEFCGAAGLGLATFDVISPVHLTNLQNSFIGTYYINEPNGIEVWGRKDIWSQAAVIHLNRAGAEMVSADPIEYLVLCMSHFLR